MHRGLQALAEFLQGGIGLLADQHEQPLAALRVHLGDGPAAAGQSGKGAGLPPSLQQSPDPGGADAKQLSNLLARAPALVTGPDDTLTKVLRIRFHTKLDARRYKQMQRALVVHHYGSEG
jgi:hypothetical protein